MTKKERLNEMYRTLRTMGLAHTQIDVANAMKASATSISCAMKGDGRYLTDNFLLRLNKAYNGIFNDNWVLMGEGEMLAPHTINQTINNGKNVNSGTAQQVGDTNIPSVLDNVVKSQQDVIKQQSEQIGKLIALLADKI